MIDIVLFQFCSPMRLLRCYEPVGVIYTVISSLVFYFIGSSIFCVLLSDLVNSQLTQQDAFFEDYKR
jgi:hypothetical protein